MLVVMTIDTEILPVRTVRGVVPGVAVFMVGRRFRSLKSNSLLHLAQIKPWIFRDCSL